MTNAEAVSLLMNISAYDIDNKRGMQKQEALAMAIKALEQQPSEDCISRAEALKAIEKEKQGWEGSERYAIDECHTRIAELPSVTPKIDGKYTFSQAYDMGYEEGVDVGYTRGYAEAMSDITEGE